MNKLFYLVFSLLILLFVGCKEEEIVINVEELSDDKKSFIVGDSILLKGENLHEVNKVYLAIENGETISAGFKSITSTYNQDPYLQENELLLKIPINYSLFGKRVELILGREGDDPKNGSFYEEKKTGMFFDILAPEIRSVSRNEFNDKVPSYIVLDNFRISNEYSIDIIQYRKTTFNDGEVAYGWVRPEISIVSDDSIKIEKLYEEGPVFLHFGWEGEYTGSNYTDIRDVPADFTLKTDSLKMYNSYNLPTDQVYAPGSFMLITDEHTNVLRFSAATVGGYTAKKSQNWSGRMGVSMPTDIPFEEGGKFEMKLLKEDDYLNIDNSHNYIELVHGNYRVVEEDENYIYFETNVYYSYLSLSYAIVTSESDTVSYDYRTSAYYEASSDSTFGLGIEKNGMPQGDHQLLIYSKDKNYQLKPAGNISFSVQ